MNTIKPLKMKFKDEFYKKLGKQAMKGAIQ